MYKESSAGGQHWRSRLESLVLPAGDIWSLGNKWDCLWREWIGHTSHYIIRFFHRWQHPPKKNCAGCSIKMFCHGLNHSVTITRLCALCFFLIINAAVIILVHPAFTCFRSLAVGGVKEKEMGAKEGFLRMTDVRKGRALPNPVIADWAVPSQPPWRLQHAGQNILKLPFGGIRKLTGHSKKLQARDPGAQAGTQAWCLSCFSL